MHPAYDVFIIGGGIDGATIAYNFSSQGLSVGLCDESDLSGASTSHNTTLFQCGLNHLENLDLGHVSDANRTRDALYQEIPHLMQPIDIVIPEAPSIRSPLKMKAGTLLYGWLRNSEICSKPHSENIHDSRYSSALVSPPPQATLCQEFLLDDARLVLEYLLAAHAHRCHMLPRTRVTSGIRKQGIWHLTLVDTLDNTTSNITARCIINAAGAKAYTVLEETLGCLTRCRQPLEKRSYIVLPTFYEGDHGYMIQLPCKNFLNVLPQPTGHCIVGPLITETQATNLEPHPSTEEQEQLLALTHHYFDVSFSMDNIQHAYSTSKAVTLDPNQPIHMLDLQCEDGQSPILSIFSSHLTTHRTLADQVRECISPYLPAGYTPQPPNYQLPGGDFSPDGFSHFINRLAELYPWLPCKLMTRYCRLYGARTRDLLQGLSGMDSLGAEVIPDLYEIEILWLIEHEWVTCSEDLLLRRTKLSLHTNDADVSSLNQWFSNNYNHRSKLLDFPDILSSQCKAS